jgi:hypothetical protein
MVIDITGGYGVPTVSPHILYSTQSWFGAFATLFSLHCSSRVSLGYI